MDKATEKLPLDARLLTNAVIELNISRHIISLYPGNHALVKKALDRAFDILTDLFELRGEISLAVAKDTLIVDKHYLDRKNPVYQEFALSLSRMCVACLTFIKGVTREEVYSFHRFLSRDPTGLSADTLPDILKEYGLLHIRVEPLDYGRFSFTEGEADKETSDEYILERYIKGLIDGTLVDDDVAEVIEGFPPEVLAGLLNQTSGNMAKEKTYDTVISNYLRSSTGHAFSGKELGRLLVFISSLRPEIKREFLGSSIRGIGSDLTTLHRALEGVSMDSIIEFLDGINEHNIALPEPLRNLLAKFARFGPGDVDGPGGGIDNLADDILLSPEITNLLREDKHGETTPDEYKVQIRKLVETNLIGPPKLTKEKFYSEWEDNFIGYYYGKTLLEIISSEGPNLIHARDELYCTDLLTRLMEEAIDTGQYGQLQELLVQLDSKATRERYPSIAEAVTEHCHTPGFISHLSSSFRSHGRMARGAAMMLSDYYGDEIVPSLFSMLTTEKSASVRKFLIGLIIRLGDKASRESLRRLADKRWYVRRNILYILGEGDVSGKVQSIRPFCRDPDPRVRLEAAKCLLKAGDAQGTETLRELMESEQWDVVETAVVQAGYFEDKELLFDLIKLLKRKTIRGSDLQRKIPVARALGQIGGPEAKEALKEVLNARSLLYRDDLEKLKKAARKALAFCTPEEKRQ